MTWHRESSHTSKRARAFQRRALARIGKPMAGKSAATGKGLGGNGVISAAARIRVAAQVDAPKDASSVERSAREKSPADKSVLHAAPDKIGYLIKELQQRLRTRIEARIRAQGSWLSFPHSAILMILQEEPGLSGAQLARRNSVTAQTMNGLLVPLEKAGLIERRADPENARILKCYLKPAGTATLQLGMNEAGAVFNVMLGKLTAHERDQFSRILRRCIDALQLNDESEPAKPKAVRSTASRASTGKSARVTLR